MKFLTCNIRMKKYLKFTNESLIKNNGIYLKNSFVSNNGLG